MDYVDMIKAMVSKAKQDEFSTKPIRTLGEVILLLETQPLKNLVKLDFTDLNPARLTSYRGYYEDIALDYNSDAQAMTVDGLLKRCRGSLNSPFTGYKGGEYIMNSKTLFWVAPYGSCGRMLIDVKSKNGITTIITKEDD